MGNNSSSSAAADTQVSSVSHTSASNSNSHSHSNSEFLVRGAQGSTTSASSKKQCPTKVLAPDSEEEQEEEDLVQRTNVSEGSKRASLKREASLTASGGPSERKRLNSRIYAQIERHAGPGRPDDDDDDDDDDLLMRRMDDVRSDQSFVPPPKRPKKQVSILEDSDDDEIILLSRRSPAPDPYKENELFAPCSMPTQLPGKNRGADFVRQSLGDKEPLVIEVGATNGDHGNEFLEEEVQSGGGGGNQAMFLVEPTQIIPAALPSFSNSLFPYERFPELESSKDRHLGSGIRKPSPSKVSPMPGSVFNTPNGRSSLKMFITSEEEDPQSGGPICVAASQDTKVADVSQEPLLVQTSKPHCKAAVNPQDRAYASGGEIGDDGSVDDARVPLVETHACALCHRRPESSTEDLGRFIGPYPFWVHEQCAVWCPEVYWFEEKLVDLRRAISRGKRLKCAYCHKVGATIGCLVPSCRCSYHLPCLLEHDDECGIDFEKYLAACPRHREQLLQSLSPAKKKSSKQSPARSAKGR
eukprot:ANDGO_04028.mRNA.1 BRCA1-associated RING domain protein 1